MHTALVERSHLELVDFVANGAALAVGVDAVLGEHLDDDFAVDDDLELGGARVNVRSVEATGIEEADGHAGPGAYKSWEGLAVGGDHLTTLSTRPDVVDELEEELIIVGEEVEAVDSGVGDGELGSEGERRCCWSSWRSALRKGRGGEGEDGSGDESVEKHDDDDG